MTLHEKEVPCSPCWRATVTHVCEGQGPVRRNLVTASGPLWTSSGSRRRPLCGPTWSIYLQVWPVPPHNDIPTPLLPFTWAHWSRMFAIIQLLTWLIQPLTPIPWCSFHPAQIARVAWNAKHFSVLSWRWAREGGPKFVVLSDKGYTGGNGGLALMAIKVALQSMLLIGHD